MPRVAHSGTPPREPLFTGFRLFDEGPPTILIRLDFIEDGYFMRPHFYCARRDIFRRIIIGAYRFRS